MRLLYFFLLFPLKYAFRIYFRATHTVNSPKEFFGSTIYVSNHPASFMDPLVVATFRRPIVFFMTRADVFTPLLKPILWASHMLPIYRQHDGEDTKKKNDEVFVRCSNVLNFGRNLLIFGEGFTDDVFIRRLKPVKKGAARIGFYALEKNNWQKNIYIAAVGINYSAPNKLRSDCLVATSDKICLNDYREEYEANPNKVLTDITKEIERRMQEQITHVELADDAPFHESVQQISRIGMHPTSSKRSLSLENRWRNSQKLAHFFNTHKERIKTEFSALSSKIGSYNNQLKESKIDDEDVIDYLEKGKITRWNNFLTLLALSPFAFLGFMHCYPVYKIVKSFVEKSFRRSVFHGSVKLLLGMVVLGLINIPFIFLFYYLVYPNWWLAIMYYLFIGIYFLAMIQFQAVYAQWKRKGAMDTSALYALAEKRRALELEIDQSDMNVLHVTQA